MLGRKIILNFFGVALSSILGFLLVIFTARLFGPSVLGEVNYYLAILGLLLLFSDLGFSRAHIRFIANKKKIKEKTGVFLAIKAFLLLLFVIAGIFYYYFVLRLSSSSVKTLAFGLLLAFEVFNRMGSSMLLTFEGLKKVVLKNTIITASKVSKLIALILISLSFKNVLGLSFAFLVEGVVLFALSLFFIKQYFPLKWSNVIFKKYFVYSLPFFAIYPLTYFQVNIDILLLKNFWNASTVGYYSAAIGIAAYLKTLNGVFITLFFPKVSQLFSSGSIKKISRITNLLVKYILIVFIPIFLFLYLFKTEIILILLGSQFIPSADIFAFSLLGIFFLMISSPYDHLIYAAGKHKIMVFITLFSVFFSVLLQLIAVPETLFGFKMLGLGGMGTVLVRNTIWFFSALIQIKLVGKYFKIGFFKQGLPVIIYFFLALTAIYFFDLSAISIGLKLLVFIITTMIFYLLSVATKLAALKDWHYFKSLLNPKALLKEGVKDFSNDIL